jgi:hypothetical protein
MHTAVDVAKVRSMIKCADVKEMSQDKFIRMQAWDQSIFVRLIRASLFSNHRISTSIDFRTLLVDWLVKNCTD